MKQVLKENLVLVAGIALPIVLCILFLVAQKVNAIGVEPPQTPVVFADQALNNNMWSFEVREGTFHLTYNPPENVDYWNPPTIYMFDPKTKETKTFKIPSDTDKKQGADIVLEDLKDLKISTDIKSPDGYEFVPGSYNGGAGLITELFSGGSSRYKNTLRKNGVHVAVPAATNLYYPTFIGWVVE